MPRAPRRPSAIVPAGDAAPLLEWSVREAGALTALDQKNLELRGELERLAALSAKTAECERLERAREALKAAKQAALDVEPVKKAHAAMVEAKAAFSALPDVVRGKQVQKELKDLDASTIERRRAMVRALFERKAPVVFAAPTPPPAPKVTPPFDPDLCTSCLGSRDAPRLVAGPVIRGKQTPPVACPRAFHLWMPSPQPEPAAAAVPPAAPPAATEADLPLPPLSGT